MSEYCYVVVPDEGGWSIDYKGHRAGCFGTRDQAVDQAVKLAREARGCGYDAEVLVTDEGGSSLRLAYAERRRAGARH